MASLPSVIGGPTLKLEPEFRKHSTSALPLEKIRNYGNTQLDKPLDSICLDFREAYSMIRESGKVESSMFVPLLQECIDKNSLSEAQSIHAHIIKTGLQEELFLMTFLVNAYGKCGSMEYARKAFDELPKRNVVTWTSLMTGYVHNSQAKLALLVFKEMLEVGAYPTNISLGIVVNACSSLYAIELGKQIHAYVVKYQIEFDTSIGNALCSLYSKCGSLNSAVKAFWRIREKNVISWTTAISACGDNSDSAMGLNLFSDMLSEGVKPNEFTLTSVFSLCSIMQVLDVGLQTHSLTIKLGYELNLPVRNSIMYLYLKCGCISNAKKLFDGMETANLITWNAMIAGHAQLMDLAEDSLSAHHGGIEALNIFLRMNQSGMKPDLFTFSSILSICSGLVALEQGEQVHAQTIKTGYLSDVVVGTSLVNMYNKCGSIERASKAFVEMSMRTLISWTAMITGYAQHGHSQQALQLFEDMRLAGVRPNRITFVGVLSACSHAGMAKEALALFEMMKNEYKIKPVMDHFVCLVDMFVRLGQLDEAMDFINKMDFEPNESIWSTLVAGCRNRGNLELGLYAAEQLLKLNPNDSETYVLLLNMYLSAGRWEDVSKVRKMVRDEKLGKLEDWSWISIKDKVYSFKPDDQFHPPHGELDKLLGDYLEKARTLGYESQGGLEVTDEENVETTSSNVVHHSEKLAVAFGLLNTPDAATIRVNKNISMCRDCHSFIKFISLLTARKIIIRDRKQLHKFFNGQCSCGDLASLL
ncbi:putative pentatricopeptide repeat-containing protein At5g52630 [Cornus florida]|uniref:putative pentatricopeptide repeat-containing protein At5g52630 n=1 Tax=Cornus florida TaxID=4283 RepID=UPI0028A0EC1B|nr:putative pentatricopeptide repeat-containing protein At5g52630 [Cornus florida]